MQKELSLIRTGLRHSEEKMGSLSHSQSEPLSNPALWIFSYMLLSW